MYVHIYIHGHRSFFGGTRGCKECGGSSMREHKLIRVSLTPQLPPPQQKKKIGRKARNWAACVFLFIYSFYIVKEVCREKEAST